MANARPVPKRTANAGFDHFSDDAARQSKDTIISLMIAIAKDEDLAFDRIRRAAIFRG